MQFIAFMLYDLARFVYVCLKTLSFHVDVEERALMAIHENIL